MSEFVEVNTAELTEQSLDWATAIATGWVDIGASQSYPGCRTIKLPGSDSHLWVGHRSIFLGVFEAGWFSPTTYWAQGGPLIERELIEVSPRWHNQHCAVNQDWEKRGFKADHGWHWAAYVLGADNIDGNHEQEGGAPLIAAMRCIVAAKLGDVVQVPSVLVEVYR